jgi:hypothetical protein
VRKTTMRRVGGVYIVFVTSAYTPGDWTYFLFLPIIGLAWWGLLDIVGED